MKNLSPSAAVNAVVHQVQSNPLPLLSLHYLFVKCTSKEIPYMTIGGWICLQSITTLMAAVTQKNTLKMVSAVAGYLFGKFIIDLSMDKPDLILEAVIDPVSAKIRDLFFYDFKQFFRKKDD